MSILSSLGLFVLAGLCEIGGGILYGSGCAKDGHLHTELWERSFSCSTASFRHFNRHNLGASMPRTVECSSCCLSCGAGGSTEIGRIAMMRWEPCSVWVA